MNPHHEKRTAEILRARLPGVTFSLSCDVCPEIREYERLSTVCANAYVQPLVAGYLSRLRHQLGLRGLRVPPFLMTSGGGITTLETGIDEPVRLVESGPAGGAILASNIATQLGLEKVLSFDMGGRRQKSALSISFSRRSRAVLNSVASTAIRKVPACLSVYR
ncbi:hypothetical protein O1V66_05135 [Rouxiella chamberiensis]|uniref:Hydantoinase A/oxoprolinase domain-containing protein n=1 Tax=Rouxiella chamberiensis TaxID=1513468 RepID=A0ABY7HRQ6_9GAMM|nr:hydantoinase/oxoprolinase family protein [Rouxiella chamberiensis]WAT02068.1 hypothetical protein O1V66_05135 [Rouxiella chamberiensis]